MDYMTFCNTLHEICAMAKHDCEHCIFFKDIYVKDINTPFCARMPSEWTEHDINFFVRWVKEHFTMRTYAEILKERFPESTAFYITDICPRNLFGAEAPTFNLDSLRCCEEKCEECWNQAAPLRYQKLCK